MFRPLGPRAAPVRLNADVAEFARVANTVPLSDGLRLSPAQRADRRSGERDSFERTDTADDSALLPMRPTSSLIGSASWAFATPQSMSNQLRKKPARPAVFMMVIVFLPLVRARSAT